ncbi:MAG: hypothetical protein MUE72_03705 [Chitinophagaceae bacterium]|nr:hypothetical protein [Chitinophagaceae bacterium]
MQPNLKNYLVIIVVLFCYSNMNASPIIKFTSSITILISDEEEIKSTVTKFFKALQKDDFKEARKYAVKDKDADNFFLMMEQMSKDPAAKKGNIPTIKDIKVDGSKAVVTFVGQPNMKLEKEDGAWKIDVRMKKPPMPKQ